MRHISLDTLRFLMVAAVLAALGTGGLYGCGSHVTEARDEQDKQYEELARLNPYQVLAGRDAEQVLLQTLSEAGCKWLEKGVASASENRLVMMDYSYDSKQKLLIVSQYSESPWGLGKTRRTTSNAVVPVLGMKAYVRPPYPLSGYQCWDVNVTSAEEGGIKVEQHNQLIKGASVSDEGRKSGATRYWRLVFADRKAAVEAWAALELLAE